jgi:Protein of unknown function (DUF2934)
MHPEDRFLRIQTRAYEIYLTRDPGQGSPEDDWWKAEREIERQEQNTASSMHIQQRPLHGLTSHDGKDFDNPT